MTKTRPPLVREITSRTVTEIINDSSIKSFVLANLQEEKDRFAQGTNKGDSDKAQNIEELINRIGSDDIDLSALKIKEYQSGYKDRAQGGTKGAPKPILGIIVDENKLKDIYDRKSDQADKDKLMNGLTDVATVLTDRTLRGELNTKGTNIPPDISTNTAVSSVAFELPDGSGVKHSESHYFAVAKDGTDKNARVIYDANNIESSGQKQEVTDSYERVGSTIKPSAIQLSNSHLNKPISGPSTKGAYKRVCEDGACLLAHAVEETHTSQGASTPSDIESELQQTLKTVKAKGANKSNIEANESLRLLSELVEVHLSHSWASHDEPTKKNKTGGRFYVPEGQNALKESKADKKEREGKQFTDQLILDASLSTSDAYARTFAREIISVESEDKINKLISGNQMLKSLEADAQNKELSKDIQASDYKEIEKFLKDSATKVAKQLTPNPKNKKLKDFKDKFKLDDNDVKQVKELIDTQLTKQLDPSQPEYNPETAKPGGIQKFIDSQQQAGKSPEVISGLTELLSDINKTDQQEFKKLKEVKSAISKTDRYNQPSKDLKQAITGGINSYDIFEAWKTAKKGGNTQEQGELEEQLVQYNKDGQEALKGYIKKSKLAERMVKQTSPQQIDPKEVADTEEKLTKSVPSLIDRLEKVPNGRYEGEAEFQEFISNVKARDLAQQQTQSQAPKIGQSSAQFTANVPTSAFVSGNKPSSQGVTVASTGAATSVKASAAKTATKSSTFAAMVGGSKKIEPKSLLEHAESKSERINA